MACRRNTALPTTSPLYSWQVHYSGLYTLHVKRHGNWRPQLAPICFLQHRCMAGWVDSIALIINLTTRQAGLGGPGRATHVTDTHGTRW